MVIKVLAVMPTYYPEAGGGALASHLMVNLLTHAEGLKLTVLTGAREPEKVKGVDYYYDPFLKLIDKHYIPQQWLTERYRNILESHDVIYIVYAYPLIAVAKKFDKKTIVHLHDYRPISPCAAVLAEALNSTNLDLLKSSFIISMLEKRSVKNVVKNMLNIPYTMMIRLWVSMADTILTASKRHAEIISKYMPECRDRIKVQYNPLPRIPKIIKRLDTTPTFLYVGGDSYLKGFPILLQTIKHMIKEQLEVKFVLAGSYRKETFKTISIWNRIYGKKIYILGQISHQQIFKIHEKTWALLFPSITEEPLPYAVVESLAVGTPVIATRTGGIIEIVKGTCVEDLLIAPRNSEELSKTVKLVMSYGKEYLENQFLSKLLYDFKEKIYNKFDEQQLLDNLLSYIK
jgi:glycosyltransferase involved in cell wall biosynthesis